MVDTHFPLFGMHPRREFRYLLARSRRREPSAITTIRNERGSPGMHNVPNARGGSTPAVCKHATAVQKRVRRMARRIAFCRIETRGNVKRWGEEGVVLRCSQTLTWTSTGRQRQACQHLREFWQHTP